AQMTAQYKRAAARVNPTDSPEQARYGYLVEIDRTPYLVTPFKNKRQRDRFEQAILADYPGGIEIALAAATTLAFAGDESTDRRAGMKLLKEVLEDYCDQYGDPLEDEDVLHQELAGEILKSCLQ